MSMKKWLIVGITVAVVVGVILYLGQGLEHASLEKFEISGLSSVNADSFTVNGNIYVNNPSQLPVPIKSIDYDVVMKDTGEVISSGTLAQFVLEPKTTTRIPFNQEINWIPAANTVMQLAAKDKVYATIRGRIKIDIREIDKYDILFSQDVDLKQYVRQFAEDSSVPHDLPVPTTIALPVDTTLPIVGTLP